MLFTAVLLLAYKPFLFLEPSFGKQYIHRWRPQIVAGNLVSVTGVQPYAKALITLENPECVGLLCTAENSAFLIVRRNNTDFVACCLWPGYKPEKEEVTALKEWYDKMLPDVVLSGSMLEGLDRQTFL